MNVVRSNEERELVAVVLTADGRRVPVRYRDVVAPDRSAVGLLRSLLLGLLALITGSRQEPGGSG
jgi:hypothetical protein